MISFGLNPYKFLEENRKKFGDTFTFLMFGNRMTYLMGAEGNNFVLNSCKLKEVSAEEAYKHLTTPVFGEGVVYDVPNHVLMEQKKFVRHGLSPENLRLYVGLIEEETRDYFKRWNGQEGDECIGKAMAELTIMTASRCLMGKEIRAQLDETVAQLYCDLDKGFTPLNFLFKWLPLESFRKRDEAHVKMRNLFLKIMQDRRNNQDMQNADMIQALMDSEYRDGRKMTDREVAHLMIALLMAGQHTSSTTGTWCLSFLAGKPAIREALIDEQKRILGENFEKPLDFDSLKEMTLLDMCIRETLRLKPPIIVLMRKVMETVHYKDFTIPAGHYLCASPALAQVDAKVWGADADDFNPYRFDTDAFPKTQEAIGQGAFSSYLPFGAGRHRCIGEPFAYIQLKTILSTYIRTFEWKWAAKGAMNGQATGEFPQTDFTTLIVMPVKPVAVHFTRRNISSKSIDSSEDMQRQREVATKEE